VDKSELEAKIAEAEVINPDEYTDESVIALKEKISAAQAVVTNVNAL